MYFRELKDNYENNIDHEKYFVGFLLISLLICGIASMYIGIQKDKKNYELVCNDQIIFTKIKKVNIAQSGIYSFVNNKDINMTYFPDNGSLCSVNLLNQK